MPPDQEAVPPETETELPNEAAAEQPQEAQEADHEKTMVPLHVVQTERRKRQEAEQETKVLKEQQAKAEADDSRYESATKEDLSKSEEKTIRTMEERQWVKNNPELFKKINEELPEFLKLKPNLAIAIDQSTNRWEEAWELMSKLSPRHAQQPQPVQKPKPQAPGSPSGVPKGAAMNETMDCMSMSDEEYFAWRDEKVGRR